MSSAERVHVFVRIRPLLEGFEVVNGEIVDPEVIQADATDSAESADCNIPFDGQPLVSNKLRIRSSSEQITGRSQLSENDTEKTMTFDGVFGPSAQQTTVFRTVCMRVLEDVIAGYNGTVLAYGQTGAGKTYTMFNTSAEVADSGLILQSLAALFSRMESASEFFHAQCSVLQLYNEQIHDCLDLTRRNLQVRQHPKTGIFVEGLSEHKIENLEDAMRAVERARRNIVIAETKSNTASSRSHTLFVVSVKKHSWRLEGNTKVISPSGVRGKLTFVDLAGSERTSKSAVENERMAEACYINTSLVAMGKVIQSLSSSKDTHVNYRDSKLTRLLQDSLGGNCKTSLIVNVSPSQASLGESIAALRFGQRACKVVTKPVLNEDMLALSPERLAELLKIHVDSVIASEEQIALKEAKLLTERLRDQIAELEAASDLSASRTKQLNADLEESEVQRKSAQAASDRVIADLRSEADSQRQAEMALRATAQEAADSIVDMERAVEASLSDLTGVVDRTEQASTLRLQALERRLANVMKCVHSLRERETHTADTRNTAEQAMETIRDIIGPTSSEEALPADLKDLGTMILKKFGVAFTESFDGASERRADSEVDGQTRAGRADDQVLAVQIEAMRRQWKAERQQWQRERMLLEVAKSSGEESARGNQQSWERERVVLKGQVEKFQTEASAHSEAREHLMKQLQDVEAHYREKLLAYENQVKHLIENANMTLEPGTSPTGRGEKRRWISSLKDKLKL